MSDAFVNFGGTLTSGIQDIAALLTLIGTEQCEKHIGSALEGGYLYVVATVLSIFGSLGIIKAGIAVLITSISIPKPSISLRPFPRLSFSSGQLLLGARVLKNAGFQLPGTVAPKIGMDTNGQRYVVETPLLEKLKEKHLGDAEKLLVVAYSTKWSFNLILCILTAAAISWVPYIHLFLKDLPDALHTLLVFPFLRTMGSCVAAVSIQFIIQSRIISVMRSRIIFMDINQLHSKDLGQLDGVKWDESLPAEECLESLQQCILAHLAASDLERPKEAAIISVLHTLHQQYRRHFLTFNRLALASYWIFLLLSIPATIAGYIGCFTLVANSRKPSGPLIWFALEATLSMFRVLLWAWNPRFDEKTQVTVRLQLAQQPPQVTSKTPLPIDHYFERGFTLSLAPEDRFLQHIAPYTGPLERFSRPRNVELYYTWISREPGETFIYTILCITVHDVNTQRTLMFAPDLFIGPSKWYRVQLDFTTGDPQAFLRSEVDQGHLARARHTLFIDSDSLAGHYEFLLQALNHPKESVGTLQWTWSLLPSPIKLDDSVNSGIPSLPPSPQDQLYLRGHEHHLKTELMRNWGTWIVDGMEAKRRTANSDWHHVLDHPTSDEARRELARIEAWLLWEWMRSELTVLKSSSRLEAILHVRMKDHVEAVKKLGDQWLERWLDSEFNTGREGRLKKEKEDAKKRMQEASKAYNDQLDGMRQPYLHLGTVERLGTERLKAGLSQIGQLWTAVMRGEALALEQECNRILEEAKPVFVNEFEQKFGQEESLRENELLEMEATMERIRSARSNQLEQLDQAYEYPESSPHLITAIRSRFLKLHELELEKRAFAAKLRSATVYDVFSCGIDIVRDVIQKSTTRSVIGISGHSIKDIPDNDHLLYVDGPKAPKFVERNRKRWWQQAEQHKSNSWSFYFSPQYVDSGGEYAYSSEGTIAHIMIFIQTPAYIRLQLVHCRRGKISVSISEAQAAKQLIHPDEIPQGGLEFQEFELGLFESGRHKLELVVEGGREGLYGLRDVLVEFLRVGS